MKVMFYRKRSTEYISCVEKPAPLPPDLEIPVAETREDRRHWRIIKGN